jgi:hypothetical protein
MALPTPFPHPLSLPPQPRAFLHPKVVHLKYLHVSASFYLCDGGIHTKEELNKIILSLIGVLDFTKYEVLGLSEVYSDGGEGPLIPLQVLTYSSQLLSTDACYRPRLWSNVPENVDHHSNGITTYEEFVASPADAPLPPPLVTYVNVIYLYSKKLHPLGNEY